MNSGNERNRIDRRKTITFEEYIVGTLVIAF